MGIQINGQTDTISAVDGSITVATDLTVPGALTYDDVTNIDSVGIITARNGLKILAGGANIVGTTTITHAEVTTAQFTGSYVNVDGNLDIADSIRHLGDSNTKIRFPAADTVTVETSGNEALRVNSSGEVSIGTVSGGKTLTLYGSSSSSLRISKSGVLAYDHTFDGSTYTIANNNGSAGIPIIIGTKTAGAESLRITSAGHVNIGGASPSSSALTVKMATNKHIGFSPSQSEVGNVPAIVAFQDNGSLTDLGMRGTTLRFATGSAERLRITSGGDIGVNTIAPSTKLHVVGDLTLQNASNNGNTWTFYKNSSRTYIVGLRGSSGNALSFYDLTSGTDAERMRIASNGQVFIGNYDTHSSSSIHGNLEVNGNDGINISNATRTGTNGVQWRLIPHNGGGSATNLRLYENASSTEVLNITKTGNIGINLTDPGTKLEVSGGQNQTANQFTDLLRVSANANNDSIDAEVQLNFGVMPSHTNTANRRSRIQSTTHAGTARALAINPAGGNVGVGVDNPSVMLDVSKATAGTIARFYDTGSNSGALYNGAPIMGLSRVSNGNISLDGLFFQVGWDKNNSSSYNIDETVFAVGNKGVGIRIDNPAEDLHMKGVYRRDNTSTSVKFHEFSFELPTGTTTTIATVTGPSASSMAIAKFEYVGLYDYSGTGFYSGVEMASLRRSNSNSAYTYLQNSEIHAGGNNSNYQPNMFWQNGSNNTSDLMITTGSYVVIMGTIRITTFNLGFTRVISV